MHFQHLFSPLSIAVTGKTTYRFGFYLLSVSSMLKLVQLLIELTVTGEKQTSMLTDSTLSS